MFEKIKREKLLKRLNQLKYERDVHDAKDFWNRSDYEYDNKLYNEIQQINKELKELEI